MVALVKRLAIGALVVILVLLALAYIVAKPSYDEALRDYELLTRDGGS